MLIASLIYSFLMLAAGISKVARVRFGLPVLLGLLLPLGPVQWPFSVIAIGYIGLTWWMQQPNIPNWQTWPLRLLWFALSAGLFIHALPGYQGLLLAEHATVKPGSIAVNLYLNTDKVLVAWSLLSWCPLFAPAIKRPWQTPNRHTLLLIPVGVVALMGLANILELTHWQPGISAWFWVLLISNLLNTCVAEELLFRGILQRWLADKFSAWLPSGVGDKTGIIAALLLSSVLFGVAHLAAGGLFVLLASLAGLLYGLVFLLSGRLIYAVLCHWALNMTQLLLLTWPMSA